MALNENELRQWEQLERSLLTDDPDLGHQWERLARAPMRRRIATAAAGVAAGSVLLVVGVATGIIAIGLLGFTLMLATLTYTLNAAHRRAHGTVGDLDRAERLRLRSEDRLHALTRRWRRRRD